MIDKDWQYQQRKCKRIIKDEEEDYIQRHCVGKVRHQTEELANKEASRMTERYNKANICKVFESYQCEFCGYYHVGREKK